MAQTPDIHGGPEAGFGLEPGTINVHDFDIYVGAAAADQMDPEVLERVEDDETPVVIEFSPRPPRTLHTPDEVFDWFDGKFDEEGDRHIGKSPSIGHTAVMRTAEGEIPDDTVVPVHFMPGRSKPEELALAEAALRDHNRRVNPVNKRSLRADA